MKRHTEALYTRKMTDYLEQWKSLTTFLMRREKAIEHNKLVRKVKELGGYDNYKIYKNDQCCCTYEDEKDRILRKVEAEMRIKLSKLLM